MMLVTCKLQFIELFRLFYSQLLSYRALHSAIGLVRQRNESRLEVNVNRVKPFFLLTLLLLGTEGRYFAVNYGTYF